MIRPSPCELRAFGSNVPGTWPPMSGQCAEFCTNATMRPSTNSGITSRTSLLCVPPMYASLITTMSPGRKYSSFGIPIHSSVPLTVNGIVPRCAGRSVLPDAIRSPSALQIVPL